MSVLTYISSLILPLITILLYTYMLQDDRLLITDEEGNGAGVGISNWNWLHEQLHLLKAYFRELCVHEIIVDHNKGKDAATATTTTATTTSNTTSTGTAAKESEVDEGHNSDPLITTGSSSLEESFKKAVLSTPGVEGLNSQLCFKIKSDQVFTYYIHYTLYTVYEIAVAYNYVYVCMYTLYMCVSHNYLNVLILTYVYVFMYTI